VTDTVAPMTEQETDLSDLITRVCDVLKLEAAYVQQQATILQASYETSTSQEIETLAGQCDSLSQKGYAAAHELTSGGVQDWVYSVKACNEVGYWATDAAGHARSAAASSSPTEIHGMLGSAVNSLDNAVYSINGA
jgi:hypothetical protein